MARISAWTKKNWERMGITDKSLTKRASKIDSKKHIFPLEFVRNKDNLAQIIDICEYFLNWWKTEGVSFSLHPEIDTLITKLMKANNLRLESFLEELPKGYFLDVIEDFDLPIPEGEDILGTVYQYLLYEYQRNGEGIYFTPQSVAEDLCEGLDFSNGQTILDPCCGSGSLLCAPNIPSRSQIFGIEKDPSLVIATEANLFIKYRGRNGKPNIYCDDFLWNAKLLPDKLGKFDYIVANPPWGARGDKESFSEFFINCWPLLKDDGQIRFLFPESMLNVKKHKELREFILDNVSIEGFNLYNKKFSGVTTDYFAFFGSKKAKKNISFLLKEKNGLCTLPVDDFRLTKNFNFCFIKNQNYWHAIDIVNSGGVYTLKDSSFAMGIVTGDNKKFLSSEKSEGMVPIYTGKNISKYSISKAENYIKWDGASKTKYQQIGREDIYSAEEKLVYRFIGEKLVFALDTEKRLFLNSANILIPKIPGMSIKTVLAFLNSWPLDVYYQTLFTDIKVTQDNLLQLPFPKISEEEDLTMTKYVDEFLEGKIKEDKIHYYAIRLYKGEKR